MKIELNNNWEFSLSEDFSSAQKVRIPHSNCVLPYNYVNAEDYQMVSYYRTSFEFLSAWQNKALLLTFAGVAHYAKVYVNGEFATEHYGGYTAFGVDIAPFCKLGENIITVCVDSRESLNIAPFGNVIDYLTYGGIYREVWLDVKEKIHIADCFVQATAKPDYARQGKTVEPYNFRADISLSGEEEGLRIRYAVNLLGVLPHDIEIANSYAEAEKEKGDAKAKGQADNLDEKIANSQECNSDGSANKVGQTVLSGYEDISDSCTIFKLLKNPSLWNVDEPNMYLLTLQLLRGETEIDRYEVKFGFRSCKFTPEGFYLNGKKLVLRGLNRHQSYPYVGYAMPARPQINDAYILKDELCVNCVRTSHYPQSQHFLDACDRLGLLVITEIPGWQHIGDEEWQKQSCQNLREMITQYRNHPSIVLWGVRINESADNDEFYAKTNKIAHKLDPSRQTGGTRYLQHSHLLEDVYTYNDFTHRGDNRGVARKNDYFKGYAPMLITEFNGHMYPTKAFDDEAHRTSQALRHAKVMEEYYKASHLCGGLGWCMFDYNTHDDFGSGDKICYHGVSDMFRNAKLAAALYASQGENPVLEISSSMDKGEWQAGQLVSAYAFTNADSVKLYLNGRFIREFFPDRSSGLPHPPILIDDFVGDLLVQDENFSYKSQDDCKFCLNYALKHGYASLPPHILLKMAGVCMREKLTVGELVEIGKKYATGWGDKAAHFLFEAIKDGEVVKKVEKGATQKVVLSAVADTQTLVQGITYDVASVRIRVKDQFGNPLAYCQEAVELCAEGAVELIGDNLTVLRGGCCGAYVKTTKQGKGSLTIKSIGQTCKINFTVN